jgi:pimeloyl-ACP methyl ester carboxylesterase
MRPMTRYAKRGGVSIAYQVLGAGPFDVVFVPGFVSHLDLFWEVPTIARVWQRIASFARLIVFDKRGTALSEGDVGVPTLEERMDDLHAVMEDVGSARAALIGISEGGPMCLQGDVRVDRARLGPGPRDGRAHVRRGEGRRGRPRRDGPFRAQLGHARERARDPALRDQRGRS